MFLAPLLVAALSFSAAAAEPRGKQPAFERTDEGAQAVAPPPESTPASGVGTNRVVTFWLRPLRDFQRNVWRIALKYGISVPVDSPHALRMCMFNLEGRPLPIAPTDPIRALNPQQIYFSLYVPEGVSPNDPTVGLFVFIPNDRLGPGVSPALKEALRRRKLIYLSPHDVQNEHHVLWRGYAAMEGVRFIREVYPKIDPDRIYVGGLMGGGKIASHLMLLFPDMFAGCLTICGVDFYQTLETPSGKAWPGPFLHHNSQILSIARAESRLAIIGGTPDEREDKSKWIADAFKHDGWRDLAYTEVPGLRDVPDASSIDEALEALDRPLYTDAAYWYERAQQFNKENDLGRALRAFGRAARHGGVGAFVENARAKEQILQADFDRRVELTGKLLDDKQWTAALGQLNELRKLFGNFAAERALYLEDRLRTEKPVPRAKPRGTLPVAPPRP